MKEEIIKSDIIAGGLGNIYVCGEKREIKAVKNSSDGSVTLTIGSFDSTPIITEDAECEIIQPKQIENKQGK